MVGSVAAAFFFFVAYAIGYRDPLALVWGPFAFLTGYFLGKTLF